jgi:DNA-binding Lrp family transcriptional regulator
LQAGAKPGSLSEIQTETGAVPMHPFFIFVKCELGKAYDVAADLIEEVEGVSEVYSISGPFELLVKVYVEDEQDIGRYVNEQIHKLPNIKDTQTIITFNAFT